MQSTKQTNAVHSDTTTATEGDQATAEQVEHPVTDSAESGNKLSESPREVLASPNLCPKECSVLCVDIDDSQNAVIHTESTAENENPQEPHDTDTDSKNGETSSWHPSEEDVSSPTAGSHRDGRRSTQLGDDFVNATNRTRRKRRRLFCQSDSSASSSPSRETRSRTKRSVDTEISTPNGSNLDKNKERTPESDDYCWMCHKVGKMVICSYCPRVYHPSCLCVDEFPDTWICPECQELLVAESTLYKIPTWKDITQNQLRDMLLFLIDRLSMQQWAEHFREPVDTDVVEGYADLIAYPMDLRTLYQRTLNGEYASTQAFLCDFRWILHNCIIFNGPSSPLTTFARNLDRACSRELALMHACPVCYIHRMPAIHVLPSTTKTLPLLTQQEWLRSNDLVPRSNESTNTSKITEPKTSETINLDPWWFAKLCNVLHPLVWVRLQNYPCWPAKVMAIDTRNIMVNFFGDYDVTTAPIGAAKLHSDSQADESSSASVFGCRNSDQAGSPESSSQTISPPLGTLYSSSKGVRANRSSVHSSVDTCYKLALTELDYHLSLIRERYPNFKLPPTSEELTRRYYMQFQKDYGVNMSKGSGKSIVSDVLTPPVRSNTSAPASDISTPSVASEKLTLTVDSQISNNKNVEPVLSRAANEFIVSSGGKMFSPLVPSKQKQSSDQSDGQACEQPASLTAEPASSSATVVLKVDVAESTNANDQQSIENTNNQDRPPAVLQPIPTIHTIDVSEGSDDIRTLLERMRSQFYETLQCLEEKWQMTRTSDERKLSNSREPPVLSAATVDCGVQTETEPFVQRLKKVHREVYVNMVPDRVDANTTTKAPQSPFTPIQAAMMENEIIRLERENQRLNLLLAYTRAEMAFEMRHRIAELRRVWNFEVTAVLEAASSIWEQDLIRIVDAVKRKQWCAYCGNVAYYYCCWNTCYCDSNCQAKHWTSHINSCVQARSQQVLADAGSGSSGIGISGISGTISSGSTEKVERVHPATQQAMVPWPALSLPSAATPGLPCHPMNTTFRGKTNP